VTVTLTSGYGMEAVGSTTQGNRMTVPDYQSLMLPILQRAAFSEIDNRTAVEAATARFDLTSEDLAQLLSGGGQTTITNWFAWPMIYMQRAGLLERKRRGEYEITTRGRKVLGKNPELIDRSWARSSGINWNR
jgi:restriction system protein